MAIEETKNLKSQDKAIEESIDELIMLNGEEDASPLSTIITLYHKKSFSNCNQLKKIKRFACEAYKYIEKYLTPEETGILGLSILSATPQSLQNAYINKGVQKEKVFTNLNK